MTVMTVQICIVHGLNEKYYVLEKRAPNEKAQKIKDEVPIWVRQFREMDTIRVLQRATINSKWTMTLTHILQSYKNYL